jgi:predicted CopG family antitoxin
MATKTISITEEAYNKLISLKVSDKDSFSDVILKYYPKKRKLSEILKEISPSNDLADAIEKASNEMRNHDN